MLAVDPLPFPRDDFDAVGQLDRRTIVYSTSECKRAQAHYMGEEKRTCQLTVVSGMLWRRESTFIQGVL